MSRKTALTLTFAPGDYLVTWQLPSATGGTIEAHGLLTVEADRSPRGTAHGDLTDSLDELAGGVFPFPQRVDVPILTGSLATGANVLLINAHVTYWFTNQARISADAAVITLANVSGADGALFKSFDVQIGSLDAIAGVAPIKSTTFPKQGAAGTWAAELRSDFKQEWSDAGATLTLTYNGTFHSSDPYAFTMGFSPLLMCELAEAVSLRQIIDEWIVPLRRVISVATGRSEEITCLTVYLLNESGAKQRGQVFGSGITQEPYGSEREEIDKTNSSLKLKADEVSLLELARNWQKLVAAHHPLVETYGSMLHALDQHPRSRFLLLLQAIEGTHGYETKASFAKRLKVHTEARDAIVDLVKGSLDEKQLKFLERNLGKRPPGGLENAINWLAKRLPGDVKEQLDATDLVATTKAAPINAKNAPDALRIVRNHLAHGTKGYDVSELRGVVGILEKTVRAHALELLGCPSDVVDRVLKMS